MVESYEMSFNMNIWDRGIDIYAVKWIYDYLRRVPMLCNFRMFARRPPTVQNPRHNKSMRKLIHWNKRRSPLIGTKDEAFNIMSAIAPTNKRSGRRKIKAVRHVAFWNTFLFFPRMGRKGLRPFFRSSNIVYFSILSMYYNHSPLRTASPDVHSKTNQAS